MNDENPFLLLHQLAVCDLESGGEVRPTLIAFAGDEPLFLATVRPFGRGGYHDPLIELGALAVTLRADRLALSIAGRAWSTQDPIPPVLEGAGDLRQRVLVEHHVDGRYGGTPEVVNRVTPYSIEGDGPCQTVSFGDPVEDSAAVGWIPQALVTFVEAASGDPTGDDGDLLVQVLRCQSLGHELVWGPRIAAMVR